MTSSGEIFAANSDAVCPASDAPPGDRLVDQIDNSDWQAYLKQRNATPEFDPEFQIIDTTSAVNSTTKPSPAPEIDMKDMERVAMAIEQACNGGFLGWGTDSDKIKDLLQDKTASEIAVIDRLYRENFGHKYGEDWGLQQEFEDEMSGAELDRAMSLLRGTDVNHGGDAARIHAALIERGQKVLGHSDEICEQEIRSKVSTMNSQQIKELEREYKEFYGTDLRTALQTDKNLSDETKAALEIYLKGIDGRHNDQDTTKLAEIALNSGNLRIFEEAFLDASPEVRQTYSTSEAGERIKNAFGRELTDGTRVESTDTRVARDFVEHGSISPVTEVQEHQTWFGDNEAAIERTVSNMTETDRLRYLDGRDMVMNRNDSSTANDGTRGDHVRTEAEQKAVDFYLKLNEELKDAGNETEVKRWEDLIQHRGGSLVGVLAGHRGVFNDDEAGVYKSIENMSKEDWLRLKLEPGFRESIDSVLSTFMNQEECQKAQRLLDQKMAVPVDLNKIDESYEASKLQGRRSLTAALSDANGFLGADCDAVYEAISNMSAEEQEKYRTDQSYKKGIDDTINHRLIPGAQQDVARGMLDKVSHGLKPELGLIERINLASFNSADLAGIVRDIEQEFKSDPTLQKRLQNPETAADKQLATAFETAVRRSVLEPRKFDEYIKPLLQATDGRLPLEVKAQLNRGIIDDNERGFYEDVLSATREERERLVQDPSYRAKVLGALSDDERQLAMYLAVQNEMRPEDELRACMLGVGTDEFGIKSTLASMSRDQIAQVKLAYGGKYGTDLISDLHDELGGSDKNEARRLLEEAPTTIREQFNRDQDRYFDTRDGVGSKFVDAVWDGTGLSLDNAMNTYERTISDYARKFQELPSDEQQLLAEKLNAAADLFVQSKGAAADALADAVLAIGAVGGAAFTGGTSLALLGFVMSSGAALKISTKAVIMGGDYDWTSSQPWMDGTTGGLDSAANFVGAGQLQKIFGMSRYGAVALSGFVGGEVSGTIRGAFNWDSRLSVSENLQRVGETGLTSGLIGAGAAVAFTGIVDGVTKGVRALRPIVPESLSGMQEQIDDVAADSADDIADSADNAADQTRIAVSDSADNLASKVDNAVPESPRMLSRDEVDAYYKQLVGADGSGAVSFKKNPNLRYELSQVNAADHPNGLLISTKESPIKLTQPMTLADGTILPEGTSLPYGVQISPASVQKVGDDLNRIIGGRIIVPGEGVRLADGTLLSTVDLAGNADFQVFKGQLANAGTVDKPGDWIVLRETTDLSGNPIYDAYTNTNSTKLKKWLPVAGESGVFNPVVRPGEAPREMVQLPPTDRIEFDTNYGRAAAGEPSFLAKQPDGSGYYIISSKDVSETMLAVDARGQNVLDSLSRPQAVASSADNVVASRSTTSAGTVSDSTDNLAGSAETLSSPGSTNIVRERGRIVEVSNAGGITKLGYDTTGNINRVEFPGESGDVWKRQGDGWVAYNKSGTVVEDRMNDIKFSVSADGNLTVDNLGYLQKTVHRADGMIEYHGTRGGYRVVAPDNRVNEIVFDNGLVAKPVYEPGSNTIARLDLSDNSSIVVKDGHLTLIGADNRQVTLPGEGAIAAPPRFDGEKGFGIRFGNRDVTFGLDEDLGFALKEMGNSWNRIRVNPDGSFVAQVDDEIRLFADKLERVQRIERNGQTAGVFEYAPEPGSTDLVKVALDGPNGFSAEKLGPTQWRLHERGRTSVFTGEIKILSDGTVQRVRSASDGNGVLEYFRLDGTSEARLPNGDTVRFDAMGRVTR